MMMGADASAEYVGGQKPVPDLSARGMLDAGTPTALGPISLAAGDFNRDGKLDLVVANKISSTITVMFGDGAGGLSPPTYYSFPGRTPASPESVAVVDVNRDKIPDLVMTANYKNSTVQVMLGDGRGGFGTPTGIQNLSSTRTVVPADLNGDGDPDLVVLNLFEQNVLVLLGDGMGGFGAATRFAVGAYPWVVAVGDINSDGKPDLVTANGTEGSVSVLFGNGLGAFSVPARYLAIAGELSSVALGDFNGDHALDVALANGYQQNVPVLLGDGAGGLKAPDYYQAGYMPATVVAGDFDVDGKLDLAVANFGPSKVNSNVSILHGDGEGRFRLAINLTVGNWPSALAVGDWNGDGNPDLAVANYGSNDVTILLGKF